MLCLRLLWPQRMSTIHGTTKTCGTIYKYILEKRCTTLANALERELQSSQSNKVRSSLPAPRSPLFCPLSSHQNMVVASNTIHHFTLPVPGSSNNGRARLGALGTHPQSVDNLCHQARVDEALAPPLHDLTKIATTRSRTRDTIRQQCGGPINTNTAGTRFLRASDGLNRSRVGWPWFALRDHRTLSSLNACSCQNFFQRFTSKRSALRPPRSR